MQKVLAIMLLFCFLSCSKDKVDPSSNVNSGQGIASFTTQWKVTDLVQAGTILIASPGTNYIYFEFNPSGLYISDNGVNECNGRYTTDNKTQIDFEEKITCTKVLGDLDSYRLFKEMLTRDVASFSVNSDTTLLTFMVSADTYIKLSRLE